MCMYISAPVAALHSKEESCWYVDRCWEKVKLYGMDTGDIVCIGRNGDQGLYMYECVIVIVQLNPSVHGSGNDIGG